MILRAIAIDDEPVALTIIEQFCKRAGDIAISVYSDPVLGTDAVMRERPDLVFLDIEMNGVSGIDIAKNLPEGTFLIFTTAYARFALDGFELNAVDFLHKPFSFSRFETAVNKVKEIRYLKDNAVRSHGTGEITVKSEYKNVNIPLDDILYIEAMDNYVNIRRRGAGPVLTQMSLKELSDMLPKDRFARIHRSFIVPLDRISKYSSRNVMLSSGEELPVGRVYSADFLDRMS